MRPDLHRGDLVVLRPASSYAVGDVVGYRNGDLKRVVVHRIIGRVDGRYVFKGDNNDFVDSFRATRSELTGRVWLHVPLVGNVFVWLHAPRHALLAALLIALLGAGGTGAEAGRRRRRRGHASGRSLRIPPAGAWAVAGLCGTAALGFGALGLLGVRAGATRLVAQPGAYLERSAYAYTATAKPGPVYPSGRVTTRDAVFTRLIHRLRIDVEYRFESRLPHSASGTIALEATLKSQQGLDNSFALAPPTSFTGDRAAVSGSLDLRGLARTIAAYEQATGVQADSYTVAVVPHVTLRATVAGETVRSRYAPTPLALALDTTKLRVLVPEQVGAAAGAPPPDPLHQSVAGSIERRVPAVVSLPRLEVRASRARRLGLEGAAAELLLCLLAIVLARRARRETGRLTLAGILRRYDSWLVAVTSPLEGAQVVDVSSMESLGRLAEHYSRAILHEQRHGVHTFAIHQDGTMYRFRLGEAQPVVTAVDRRRLESA
jgi:signal peptidase